MCNNDGYHFIGMDMAAGPDKSVTVQVTPEMIEQLRQKFEEQVKPSTVIPIITSADAEFIGSRPVNWEECADLIRFPDTEAAAAPKE